MFRGILYRGEKNQLETVSLEQLAHCRLESDYQTPDTAAPLCKANSFLWIDITAPTDEELAVIASRFHLDSQIVEDLRLDEGRPKLHDYDGYIYLIFHAIALVNNEEDHQQIDATEIDCLLGPDWILTLHPKQVQEFDEIANRWQRRPDWMRNGPANMLYELMDAVLDNYFPVLEKLDERIDTFEDRLYGPSSSLDDSTPISGEIFGLKRILLRMRHIAGPTRDVVNILLRRDSEEGGHHFAAFQDLYDHSSRIAEHIDTYREILSGALDAYLAVESNRMNAVMKRLTAYSIILLLPTLIAGIYGMNFDDMPKHHGFWNSLGAMVSIVAILIFYFRRRNWL